MTAKEINSVNYVDSKIAKHIELDMRPIHPGFGD
jgi:hypothetical protein